MRALAVVAWLALSACGPTVLRERPDVAAGGSASVEQAGDAHYVRLRGQRLGPFVAIGSDSLRTSPDGAHWAFTARDESGWRVYVDGRAGRAWHGVGELVWSHDGADHVYAASDGERWYVVGPGEAVGPAFDGIVAGSLQLAGEPPVSAYFARDASGVHVLVGARRFGPFEAVGALRLDAEGRHFGFVERRGEDLFVHVDGASRGPFEDVAELRLAPRGGGFMASVLDEEGAWRALERGSLGPPWSSIGAAVFDAQGERLAYAAASGPLERASWYVVVDGERRGPFDHVDHRDLRFSRQGSALAFAARSGGQVWVYERELPVEAPFLSVSWLGYAETRPVLGFVGHDRRDDAIVVGGVVRERAPEVRTLRLSPSGERYAATILRSDGVTLSVDGRHHDYLDVVDATMGFDGTGAHWAALAATTTEEELVIVRDGVVVERLPWDELAALLQAAAKQACAGGDPFTQLRGRVQRVLSR